ncbi:MAG TPA: hypothetical protein VIS96_02280, partial [Terrimicrobiaceae bacterium]
MGVLEFIAEERLGADALRAHPEIRLALEKAEQTFRRPKVTKDEKVRISSLVELCFEYHRESDPDERENILRTLLEISTNEPLAMPTQTLEEWDTDLRITHASYVKADRAANRRIQTFLKKY